MMPTKKLQDLAACCATCAVGVAAFTLSSYYFRNGITRISCTLFPQCAVYALLGFFHAYGVWQAHALSQRKAGGGSLLMLFGLFLVYTAWYGIVLLPESGLGYVEWAVMLIALAPVFAAEAFGRKVRRPFLGQRPMALVFFGVVLFLCKGALFYFFADNLYDSLILTNRTARFCVALFALIGAVLLVLQLGTQAGNRSTERTAGRARNAAGAVARGMLRTAGAAVRAALSVLGALVTGPALIIVLLVAGLLVLAVSFFAARGIYADVRALVEPILEKLASTGEAHVVPSTPYYALQTVSLALVLFHTVWLEQDIRRNVADGLCRAVRRALPEDAPAEARERIRAVTEPLLEAEGFSGRLRLLTDESTVARAAQECMGGKPRPQKTS